MASDSNKLENPLQHRDEWSHRAGDTSALPHIERIKSDYEFESAINMEDGNVAVLAFDADWHKTWKVIHAKLQQLSENYIARFYVVNVAEYGMDKKAQEFGVKVLPTFLMFKKPELHVVEGPEPGKVEEVLKRIS